MKNRKLGKILLVALFAMLFAALLVVNVGAEDLVTVDVTNEAELKAAVAADSTADVVNLVGTIQITDTVNVEKSVTITSATNATVVGKMAATSIDWSGSYFNVLSLADGVELTMTGNVVWSDVSVVLNANNVLNLTGSVQLLAGINCHAIYDNSATSATINIADNALIEGKFAYYSREQINCAAGSVKTWTMNGGEINATYGIQTNARNATGVIDFKNGLINTTDNPLHMAMGVTTHTISLTNMTINSGNNVVKVYSACPSVTITIDGGNYTAVNNIINLGNTSAKGTVEVKGGTFNSTKFWNKAGAFTFTKTGGELTSNEFVVISANNKATFHDTLADALAAAVDGDVIEVWGETTSGNVNVNASVTFVGNGTVNGECTLTVADGKSVTFAGNTKWNDCAVAFAGNNSATFTENVKFIISTANSSANKNIITDTTLTDTTVTISGNAELSTTGWITNYSNSDGTTLRTKTFTMTGGSFHGNFGLVYTTGQVKIVANISNATISANINLFHLDAGAAYNANTCSRITLTNVTATAGRYVVGVYKNAWANVTIQGANGKYTVLGEDTTTGVTGGAIICMAGYSSSKIDATIADGTFVFERESGEVFSNTPACPAVVVLPAAIQTKISPKSIMPNGAHIKKSNGDVICCSTLALAMENDADGDVIEILGTTPIGGHITVDKRVTINGNGTVTGGNKVLFAGAAEFTLGGSVTWQEVQIRPVANTTSTVNITDNVVISGTSTNTAVVLYDNATANLTVNISGNAALSGAQTIRVDNVNGGGSLTVTMNGGKISGTYVFVVNTTDATIDFNLANGTVEAQNNAFHLDNTNTKLATITLTDMTVKAGLANASEKYMVTTRNNSNVKVTVNGGTYTSTGLTFTPAASASSKMILDLQAGTFTGDPVINFANSSYLIATINDACVFNPELAINNFVRIPSANGYTYYQTLAKALENAVAGNTVEIVGNVTMGGDITIDKNITINGNGTVNNSTFSHITVSGAEVTFAGTVAWTEVQIRPAAGTTSTVNFKGNVSILNASNSNSQSIRWGAVVYYNDETANLTINISENAHIGGTRTFYVSTANESTDGSLTVTMNGGKISGTYAFVIDTTAAALDFDLANGTIEMQNNALHYNNSNSNNVMTATLTNMTVKTGLNGNAQFVLVTYNNSRVNATVNGGTYTSTGISFNVGSTNSKLVLDLQAGTFTGNPVLNFNTGGYLIATVNDACTLTPALSIANGARIVHENGYTYYQTLDKALDNAVAGDTIEVIGANTLSATRTIDKNLTITGANGTTVTCDSTLFNVTSGAKLILSGYTQWTSGSASITVGAGGAHIVFTDAVKVTNTKASDDSNGAIVLDKNDATNTTIEVLKNNSIDGEPVLTCTDNKGWGFDFEKVDGNATSGTKTVKMECGTLYASYAIVFNINGVVADIDLSNATITARKNVIYFNNAYVAANANESTIVLNNVTVPSCEQVFNTQNACHVSITDTNGNYTASVHIYNIDYAGSIVDLSIANGNYTCTGKMFNLSLATGKLTLSINGGTYTGSNFVFQCNNTNLESLITIGGNASFTGSWFFVAEGLTRTNIAWDTITVNTGANNKFAYARTASKTDSTTVYGSLANVVAYAPANSIVEISGNPGAQATVTIDKNLTITGVGNITADSGVSLFVVKNGAKLVLSGSAHWKSSYRLIEIGEGGGHIVVTDTVVLENTVSGENGSIIHDALGNVNTTVEVLKSDKGAPTLKTSGWTIDFEGEDGTVYTSTKRVNITGGTFSGSHPIVFNVGGTTADVYVKDATFTATEAIVYINNRYFATAGANGKGNVGSFELVNVTVTSTKHLFDTASTDCVANVTVTGGSFYSTSHTYNYDRTNCQMNTTITGGTYVTKDKFYNGLSKSTTVVTNVDVTAGYDPAAGAYLTSGGYAITFGTSGVENFTIGGADTIIRAPLRVFAIHDNSKVTLNIDGGTYLNTTTTYTASRFVIYQSSANGAASTLTLNAKNASFLNYAYIDGSSTFQVNDAGSKTTATFDNCTLIGSYIIRTSNGTQDLTIKGNTKLQLIGIGENRTGEGSGIFLGGSGKKTLHLISGSISALPATETIEIDGQQVVLNAGGYANGVNLREDIVFDITMEKDFSIIASGLGIKNNKGRCVDSKLTINGGYIYAKAGPAIGFYARSSNVTKPSTLYIYDGTFASVSGNALQFYTDGGAVLGYVYGGTFTSESNTAIYAHSGISDYADTTLVTLNIYDCICITQTSDAALSSYGAANDLTDKHEAIVNVYGGYYEGHNLCAARASTGGTLNVYGGTYRYKTDNSGNTGAPIRSGTGSNIGVVHIYGGNFYTTSTAASGLFTCMNAYSFLTVHGGFNGIGGRVIFEDYHADANGGYIVHELGTQVVSNSIRMIDGAAVRLASGSNGLRFKSVISAEAMAYINSIADAGSVKFGTIITPADFLEGTYAFTAAELDRLGRNYLDLVADNGLVANEDGSYTICAAITNIKEENVDRNFAATSYVEYTIDGQVVRVYSNYRELKNNRSIAQVARIALTYAERYTEAQRNVLGLYAPDEQAPVLDIYLVAGQSNGAGCSNFTENFKNSDSDFVNGYSNILYHGVSAGGDTYAAKRIYENVLVKAGYGCGLSDIGPELGMAKALSQYYNEETGRMAAIVKYAYGGTGLADSISGQNFPEGSWTSPTWLAENGKVDEYKSGGLYRAFVAQIQSAISDYRALGYEINIVGGYWMQGENDRTKDVNTYAAMFETWLNDLRADVYAITGDEADLKMPMLVGEISDYFNNNNYESNKLFTQMQREQIGALENVHVINNGTIPTLDHSDDKAHWDSHSALWIGQNVGITFLTEYLNSEYVVSDEDLVAEVVLGGEVLGRYDSLVGAINDAPDGAVIELKKDLTLYSTLAIGNRNKITLNGNNHRIDFVLPASDNHTSMIMWYDTDMTVNDLHISHNNNSWGTQLRQDADVVWNGGSIVANQFCFVINTNGNLTLNSGDFSVVNSSHVDAAIVYAGNFNTFVTVNGGTYTTTDGNAVGIHVRDQALITVNGGDWTCTGTYIFELVGTTNTLVLDKENTTLNEGYKTAPIYNAGYGHVEDDAEGDIFED